MTPNWDAFRHSIEIFLVATPFMFGVLTLFSGTIYLLSFVRDPREKSE